MKKRRPVIIRRGKGKAKEEGFSRLVVKAGAGVQLEEIAAWHLSVDKYQVVLTEHVREFEIAGFRPGRHKLIARKDISDQNVSEKIKSLEEQFIGHLSSLENDIHELSENFDSFKRDTYKEKFLSQHGATEDDSYKIIPIRAYLSSETSSELLTEAIQNYIDEIDGEIIENYHPIHGSWFKEWVAKVYNGKTKAQIESDLQKTRKAIELKTISNPQSVVDSNNSDAISKLVIALNDQEYAVLQIGALLVAKYQKNGKPILVSKVLNVDELIWLESNQQLLSEPESILEQLAYNTRHTQPLCTEST